MSRAGMDILTIPNINSEYKLQSAEKAQLNPAFMQMEKPMTSMYLNFFETSPDRKSQKCKFCKQRYSIATETGKLGRHLSYHHPGYDQLENTSQGSSPTVTTETDKSLPQIKISLGDVDHLNWVLLKCMIGVSGSPSSFDDELLDSLRFLNPSARLWPREKFSAVTLRVFRSMQDDVIKSLQLVDSKVSLTLDFWTSYEQDSYMSIKAHWIGIDWTLHKVLLDVAHLPSPYGGFNIYLVLMKVLQMFNLEKRTLSCTTDGSQAAVHACRALQEEMDARKAPFCYIPCAAQLLLSMVEDGLRPTRHILSKIREFALKLNASAQMAEDFTQAAMTYKEGSWKFPIDTSHSWAGDYTMLDLVIKAPVTIDIVLRKHGALLGDRCFFLSPAEKTVAESLHKFLEPFHRTSTNLCSCKVPTVGLSLFFIDHISENVTTEGNALCYGDWLHAAAKDMSKRAWSFSDQVYNPLIYMAVMLDPRILKELAPECLNTQKNLEDARTHFLHHYYLDQPQASPTATNICSASGNAAEEGAATISFAEVIACKRRKASSNASMDELSRYLLEATVPFTDDPLEWWKVNYSRYPRLSVMARDFLAIQGTLAEPEEVFTGKAETIMKKRLALPHSYVQAVLCIQSWLESGYKLKVGPSDIHFDSMVEQSASAAGDVCSLNLDRKPRLQ